MNSLNKSPIYVKERQPKSNLVIKQRAENINLITTTLNSQVKVIRKIVQGVVHNVGVDSLKAVDDIKEIALQKVKRTQPM